MSDRNPTPRPAGPRDRFSLINRRNLNFNHFTQSLISEALRVGLLPMETVDDVQMQVMGRLEVLIREQTKLTGLPVGEEEAKVLLDSVFCTLDTYLLAFHDPMYAITAIQSTSVDEMFTGGRHLLKGLLCETVSLYVSVRHTRVPTDSLLYRETLDSDVRTFLDLYDYKYHAQNLVCRMRYPLSKDRPQFSGISYLRDYLRCLLTENRLLSFFDPEETALLIRSYASLRGIGTEELTDNLFSAVMQNAMGSAILGKYTGILTLTEEEVDRLYSMLLHKTTREIEAMTAEAASVFLTDMRITDNIQSSYIRVYAKNFIKKLLDARTSGAESRLFTPSDPLDLFKQ